MKKILTILICFFVFRMSLGETSTRPCSHPIAENQMLTFGFDVDYGFRIKYYVPDGSRSFEYNKCTCNDGQYKCDPFMVGLVKIVYYEARRRRKSTSCPPVKVELTATALSRERHGGRFELKALDDPSIPVQSCSYQIYDFPDDVIATCTTSIEIEEDSGVPVGYLLVQCLIYGVFPDPLCKFDYSYDDESGDAVSPQELEVEMEEPESYDIGFPLSKLTYDRKCNAKLPVEELHMTSYTFTVTWYPNVMDGSTIVTKQATTRYTVEPPDISCNPSEISPDGDLIIVLVLCSSDSPFKFSLCSFQSTFNEVNETHDIEQQVDLLPPQCGVTSGSCLSQCSLKRPLLTMFPGVYGFRVTMTTTNGLVNATYRSEYFTNRNPLNASCSQPDLSVDGQWVTVDCYTDSPYQDLTCSFQSTLNNTTVNQDFDVQDFPSPCDGDPVSCRKRCRLKRLVSEMEPGIYRFQVNMSTTQVDFPVAISPWTESIDLTSPTATITNETNGYIKEGTTAYATCEMTSPGNPPSTLYWTHVNGTVLSTGQPGQSSLLIHFSFDENDSNQKYCCYAKSSLNHTVVKHTLTPIFAYGPQAVQISSEHSFTFNKCPQTSAFSISCDVELDRVSPDLTATLEIMDDSTYHMQKVVQESGISKTYFQVLPNNVGEQMVKCVAINSLYSDLQASAEKAISVYAPPSSPPMISIDENPSVQNGSTQSVMLGRSINVRCQVDGGYPVVRNVTLDCEGDEKTDSGNQVSKMLQVNRELHKGQCICSADHLTDCYSLTSTFYFDVKSTIQIFYVGTESSLLEVDQGTNVVILCQAEGNPIPSLLVQRKRTGENVQTANTDVSETERRVDSSINLDCLDTDIYECLADNDVGMEHNRTIEVLVKCSSHLVSIDEIPKAEEDKNLTIVFNIYGHPVPVTFSLVKMTSSIADRKRRTVSSGEEVDPSRYEVSYDPGPSKPFGRVVLVIVKMERSDVGQFDFVIDNGVGDPLHTTFDISVDLKDPLNASCSQPDLSVDGQWVTVDCYTDSPYQNLACSFQSSLNNTTENLNFDVQDFPSPCHGHPVSCYNSCRLKRLVSEMEPGIYRFKVNMSTTQVDFPVAMSPWTESIALTSPTATITNETNGYIKEGTTAYVTCQMTSPGNPQSTLYWTHANGTVLSTGQPGQSSLLIHFSFDENDNNQEYCCYAKSSLNHTVVKHTLTPIFAYGPQAVQISSEHSFTFNKCPQTSAISISCNVELDKVSPNLTSTLEIMDDSTFPVQKVVQESGISKTYFQVLPNNMGEQMVKCVAINSLYSDLQTSAEKVLSVYAPPSSPPLISIDKNPPIQNGSAQSVMLGQSVNVTCQVDGGYPVVRNVTLDCEGNEKTDSGNEVTKMLQVNKELHKGQCICSADHITDCYSLTSTFYFDVKFSATIQTFNVGSESSLLEVDQGTTVVILCQAEGSPSPSLLVQKKRTGENVQTANTDVSETERSVNSSITLDCLDTDIYECLADNDVGMEYNRTIEVLVKCSSHLVSMETIPKAEEGKNLTIVFNIYGHPVPYTFSLVKMTSSIADRKRRTVSSGEEVNPSRYEVSYDPGPFKPFGRVVLVIIKLESSDIGQFDFVMDNGVGDPLHTTFDISLDLKESEPLSAGTIAVMAGVPIYILVCVAIICLCYWKVIKGRKQIADPGDDTPSKMKARHDQSRTLRGTFVIPRTFLNNFSVVTQGGQPPRRFSSNF